MSKINSNKPGKLFPFPLQSNDYLAEHVQLMHESLHTFTGRDLVDTDLSPMQAAKQIFHAPFVVLSHNTATDPILTYSNLVGLELFELRWEQLVLTPSRNTAETPERGERMRLLEKVAKLGYIDDYAGVRVSSSGRRFRIERATVWNLAGKDGEVLGQAAKFDNWTVL